MIRVTVELVPHSIESGNHYLVELDRLGLDSPMAYQIDPAAWGRIQFERGRQAGISHERRLRLVVASSR